MIESFRLAKKAAMARKKLAIGAPKVILLSGLFAFIQVHLISLLFKLPGYRSAVDAALGVVTRHPDWKVDQSRVLSPYLVQGIAFVTRDYLSAHVVFSLLMLTIAGVLAWRLGQRIGEGTPAAALSFMMLQFGFVFLLSPPWLYAWDYTGLVLFLIFVDFVLERRQWSWFAGLFVVAILNRESGEFIALWMILDPFARKIAARIRSREPGRVNWAMVIAGSCCMLCGAAIIHFLRSRLMVEEVGPRLFPAVATEAGKSLHFELVTNLKAIAAALRTVRHGFQAVLLLFPLTVVVVAAGLIRADAERFLGLALVSLANVAALLLIGVFFESRVYLELLPFVILGVLWPMFLPRTVRVEEDGRFTSSSTRGHIPPSTTEPGTGYSDRVL
jgi:hypothetical protein